MLKPSMLSGLAICSIFAVTPVMANPTSEPTTKKVDAAANKAVDAAKKAVDAAKKAAEAAKQAAAAAKQSAAKSATKKAADAAKRAAENAKQTAAKEAALKTAKAAQQSAKTGTKTKSASIPVKTKAHPDSKFSYAVGHNFGSQIGRSLSRGKIYLDKEALLKGVREGLQGKGLSRGQVRMLLMQLRRKFQANMNRNRKKKFGGNLIKGKIFLARNAKKKGVKVLPSGLQYIVIKPGTGRTPTGKNTVETHYRGTLIDGTEFDSSYKRGRPARFGVNGVIRGWTEALKLMKEGAKWKLFIPYNLAYGTRGAGPKIGPYATLIFDIELIKIVK